jgi:ubiquinone/menaquinone biosynthesis C-methylase UbiE
MDAIWNMAALVHLEKAGKEQAIVEYQRILSPGGILHISVQNLLSNKHLERVVQSYSHWLGYDENNQFYQVKKTPDEVRSGLGLIDRCMQGYAYLDDRHWFFPTKLELVSVLKKHGFEVIESNSTFAKRTSIFARKKE